MPEEEKYDQKSSWTLIKDARNLAEDLNDEELVVKLDEILKFLSKRAEYRRNKYK